MARVRPNRGQMSQTYADSAARRWPPHMRRDKASQYLLEKYGISLKPATLAKKAVVGGGPPFRYDGRYPIYDQPDLDSFAIARLGPLRSSTSDTGQQLAT